jgi:biopolymer transport protein ExbD
VNFGGKRRGRRAEINLDLTPMVDVVFQLVLFLLLSTTFKTPKKQDVAPREDTPAISVDLPRAGAEAVIRDKKDVNVWIAASGEIFVGADPVDLAALRVRFQDAKRDDPGTLVVVKADRGVSHGDVVEVMDLARAVGLNRLAIATAPR